VGAHEKWRLISARRGPYSGPRTKKFCSGGAQVIDQALGGALTGEIFYILREAQIVIDRWRRLYNAVRPRGSLGQPPSL
jgi:hypothetical protein